MATFWRKANHGWHNRFRVLVGECKGAIEAASKSARKSAIDKHRSQSQSIARNRQASPAIDKHRCRMVPQPPSPRLPPSSNPWSMHLSRTRAQKGYVPGRHMYVPNCPLASLPWLRRGRFLERGEYRGPRFAGNDSEGRPGVPISRENPTKRPSGREEGLERERGAPGRPAAARQALFVRTTHELVSPGGFESPLPD